jgi:hypothetical protein
VPLALEREVAVADDFRKRENSSTSGILGTQTRSTTGEERERPPRSEAGRLDGGRGVNNAGLLRRRADRQRCRQDRLKYKGPCLAISLGYRACDLICVWKPAGWIMSTDGGPASGSTGWTGGMTSLAGGGST